MPLPTPTIVIFDMDGTTVRHMNPRLLHIFERMDDISFNFHRFWGRIMRRGDKATIYKTLDGFKAQKKRRLIVHRAIHKVRRKPVEQIVEPCPGIYAVLTLLKTHGVRIGLVSNGLGKGYGHDILQKFGLENYFEKTLFREDIHHSKPNPEAILNALKALGASENDAAWYVGDRHKDVAAALAAQKHAACGITPVAYGLNAALAIIEKNVGPDRIIMSYYEMYEVLAELFGRT